MGSLFDKTKVYLATSTAKLFREDNDPVTDAALGAVLNNESIPNYIQATGLSGPGTTIRNYMNYGRSTYVHGLPEVKLYAEWAKNQGVPDPQVPINVISWDPAYLGQVKELEIYPMVPLKKDGVYTCDLDKSTQEYITPRRILRKVSTKIKNLDNVLKANPEESKVDDCYFTFSLDIYTQVEDSIGYLWEFFFQLAALSPVNILGFEASLLNSETSSKGPVRNNFEVTEGESHFKITYDYMTSETVAANMEDDIHYASSFTFAPHEEYLLGGGGPEAGIQGTEVVYRVEKTTASFRQRRSNPDEATQVTIYGLIFETYATALGAQDTMLTYLNSSFVGLEPDNALTGTSGIYIPMSHDILPKFTVLKRHRILTDAMLMTFVAAEEVDLEWYQTGIVKLIVMAVSFYLLSVGIGAGIEALGAMAAQDFIIAAAVAVGLNFIIELILTNVDGAAGAILSMAAIVAATYIPGIPVNLNTMPIGSKAMFAMNAVGSVANKYVAVQGKEVQTLIEAEVKNQEVKTAELKNLIEENPEIQSELFALVLDSVLSNNFSENPNSYYSRTTDISVVQSFSINQPENFLESMLTLPKLSIKGRTT